VKKKYKRQLISSTTVQERLEVIKHLMNYLHTGQSTKLVAA